jgi:hypothetical protein
MSEVPVLLFIQERELEKVNTFYLQKEAEVCLRAFVFCAHAHCPCSCVYGSRPS